MKDLERRKALADLRVVLYVCDEYTRQVLSKVV